MAAGDRLFVLVKAGTPGAWALVAGPVSAAAATEAVTNTLTATPGARVIVATVVRSFRGAVTTAEDADPVAGL